MNKVEFIKGCYTRGYCDKKQATAYCKEYDKDDYNEQDFIDVYRYYESLTSRYDNPNFDYIPLNNSVDGSHGYKVTPLNLYYEYI